MRKRERDRERGEGNEKGNWEEGGVVDVVEADAAALCMADGLIVS